MQNRHTRRPSLQPELLSQERALIVIDEAPIRQPFFMAIRRALKRMRRMKSQILEFDSLDRPAFARWMQKEFATELAEADRLQRELSDLRAQAHAIEAERISRRCSYHEAFESIINNGPQENESPETEDFADDFESEEYSRSQRSENIEFDFGTSDEDSEISSDQEKKNVRATAEKIREIYRKLVRLLHPDLCQQPDEWSKELWYQTQEAFKAADLEQLDTLLVVARLHLMEQEEDNSVSSLQSALDFLKSEIAGLNPQFRVLKKEPAWGFSQLKDHSRLQRRLGYELDEILEDLQCEIDDYAVFIDQCATPRRGRRGRGRR